MSTTTRTLLSIQSIGIFLLILFCRVVQPLQSPLSIAPSRFPQKVLTAAATRGMFQESAPASVVTPSLIPQHSHRSLIDSFLVDIVHNGPNGDMTWSLIPIDEVVATHFEEEEKEKCLAAGAKSFQALFHDNPQPPITLSPAMTLCSQVVETTIYINITSTLPTLLTIHAKLLSTMARIVAQYAAAASTTTSRTRESWTEEKVWDIVITSELETEQLSSVQFSIPDIATLFKVDSDMEIVDMVDQHGTVLGMVPRNLVHSLNILHRGIGLTVSKDANFSELYVHRRTDSKRIFPGLHDMFVGGVSSSGENSRLTAAREVAEELGLSRALDDDEASNALSEPLFQCLVCTSYNRCVVTVFQYTMDPTVETISWQKDEVSWGDFVPYDIVEAAADLSIQRLVKKNDWPGMLPAIQSKQKGKLPPETQCNLLSQDDWTTWDFVPDGLLVWEAWLKWRGAV